MEAGIEDVEQHKTHHAWWFTTVYDASLMLQHTPAAALTGQRLRATKAAMMVKTLVMRELQAQTRTQAAVRRHLWALKVNFFS